MKKILLAVGLGFAMHASAQEMPDMWTKTISADAASTRPDTKWFEDAKFGLFIHWGLYSTLGNEWQGKNYYGSGEWIMNRAKISVNDYAKLVETFNPTGFNADEWATFAREAGVRYLVITAKHHEGFAMFGSKASPFNIVDATPYKRDPMKELAEACRRAGVKFGFYYSQFLDWHEPDGGGNTWDFKKEDKDVKKYYAEKSIPQIRELLSNYGPLDIVWFDMPGGLTREETVAFMGEVRRVQPTTLISSRVGQGLGDFRDFGDSELPPKFISGPWEAIFTHTDSWGYVKSDQNFKTPRELVRLLASASARGGNLMVNVGPDGTGRIPQKSLDYLREVGRWLGVNGESIYGTTHSPIPDQPWGVATVKPGKLFLHVFTPPKNREVIVPSITSEVTQVKWLAKSQLGPLTFKQVSSDLVVTLPANFEETHDTVIVVEHAQAIADAWETTPTLLSKNYDSFSLEAADAKLTGETKIKSITHSRYYGNWKHDTCVIEQKSPNDKATFSTRTAEAGDYRVTLEYACPPTSMGREGLIEIGDQKIQFETLLTRGMEPRQTLMLVRHVVGVVSLPKSDDLPISIAPLNDGPELFWLRRVILEPVH